MHGVVRWGLRALMVVAGLGLLASAAALAVLVAPQSLAPQAGDHHAFQEQVRYWTPEDGWRNATRDRTMQLQDLDGRGLRSIEHVGAPTSPRGRDFSFQVDRTYMLTMEEGLRIAVPPTPYLHQPRSDLYLAVPWDHAAGDYPGAIDHLQLVGTEERDSEELLRYEARHQEQFYVPDDETVWFRAVERTLWAEPVTGLVVDYRIHETLDRQRDEAPVDLPMALPLDQDVFEVRERVWEAHVTLTDQSHQQRMDQARQERGDYHQTLALYVVPAAVAGETLALMGLAGRPRRWFGGREKAQAQP